MNRLFLITLLIPTLVAAAAAQCPPPPTPSYQLPSQGTIVDWGPNGVTLYHYQDHGRSYQSLGPNGSQTQQDMGGGVIFRSTTPGHQNDSDVNNILRQWQEEGE